MFGVKPCEFWKLTVREVMAYFKAQRMQREEKNFFCYLQGVYINLVFSPKESYPKEPIRLTPLTEKEKEEQEEKELQKLVAYLDRFKKDFDKKEVAR